MIAALQKQEVSLAKLQIGEEIGRGGFGVVHKGEWGQAGANERGGWLWSGA